MAATENNDLCSAQTINSKRTYTVPEIAQILQISKTNAYELCKKAGFQVVHIGRSVRVSKKSFDEWLDRNYT